MKFAQPIKFFRAGCAAAVIGLGTMRCKAPIIPPPTNSYAFPPIGTLQKVTDYAAQNVNTVIFYSWIYETNGQEAYYGGGVWYKETNTIASKIQLDQQFIAPVLSNTVLHSVCTNTNPILDKNGGVIIYIGCDI